MLYTHVYTPDEFLLLFCFSVQHGNMMPLSTRDLALALLVVLLSPVSAATDWQTWGPYRPGLYFGVRPQIPDSVLMGLMWTGGNDKDTFLHSMSSLLHRQFQRTILNFHKQTFEKRASRMMG